MEIKVPSKKVFTFEIEGEKVQMRRPTIREFDDYVDEYSAGKTNKERTSILFKYLDKLGLPTSVAESLDPEQLDFLVSALTDTSKKN